MLTCRYYAYIYTHRHIFSVLQKRKSKWHYLCDLKNRHPFCEPPMGAMWKRADSCLCMTASKKTGTSVVQPQKTEFCQQKRALGNPVLYDSPEGWGGVGARGRFKKKGTHVYLELNRIAVWQKPTEHCTAVILQLKQSELGSPGPQQWAPKPPYENWV